MSCVTFTLNTPDGQSRGRAQQHHHNSDSLIFWHMISNPGLPIASCHGKFHSSDAPHCCHLPLIRRSTCITRYLLSKTSDATTNLPFGVHSQVIGYVNVVCERNRCVRATGLSNLPVCHATKPLVASASGASPACGGFLTFQPFSVVDRATIVMHVLEL